jgi:uracil-DNA glycosylase
MPTYHPAFLLRDESRKGEAWHDLKEVMALLKHMGLG